MELRDHYAGLAMQASLISQKLIIRFESFTREKINNLTECDDED